MSRSRLVRTVLIGSVSTALAVGVGAAMMAPASAHEVHPRPPFGVPWEKPIEVCLPPIWSGQSGFEAGSVGFSWDDDWSMEWFIGPCTDQSATAQADLEAALSVAQSTYDDSMAKARSAYNAAIADELAAYREDRAGTRSQIARLLIWRGFVAATRDEQRALNRATDVATRNLALDQDAAYEIFDLETTDETIAAGRTDFRAARAAAERTQTLALRVAGNTYELAVDAAVQRLAVSQEESGSTIGRARAWKAYRQSLAAARSARVSAGDEVRAQFDSALAEAASMLVPGDESYVYDNGLRPVPMPLPMPHHGGHGRYDND